MEHTVNAMIKKIRKSRHITQETMAEVLGVPRSTYHYKESTGSFTFEEYIKITDYFGLSLDGLKTVEDVPDNSNYTFTEETVLRQPPVKLQYDDEEYAKVLTRNELLLLKSYRQKTPKERDEILEYIKNYGGEKQEN